MRPHTTLYSRAFNFNKDKLDAYCSREAERILADETRRTMHETALQRSSSPSCWQQHAGRVGKMGAEVACGGPRSKGRHLILKLQDSAGGDLRRNLKDQFDDAAILADVLQDEELAPDAHGEQNYHKDQRDPCRHSNRTSGP